MIVIKFLYLGKCVGMLSFRGTLADPGEELGGVYPPVDADGIHQVDTVVVHNGKEVKVYSGFTHWGDIIGGSPEMLYPCGHYEIWSGDTQEAEKKECLLCANLKGADLSK